MTLGASDGSHIEITEGSVRRGHGTETESSGLFFRHGIHAIRNPKKLRVAINGIVRYEAWKNGMKMKETAEAGMMPKNKTEKVTRQRQKRKGTPAETKKSLPNEIKELKWANQKKFLRMTDIGGLPHGRRGELGMKASALPSARGSSWRY